MNQIELKSQIRDREICAQTVVTDNGIQVIVAGGDKSHIGAVCVVDPKGNATMHCFPGHKEAVITERWALALYKKAGVPVVVSAGIHFDTITKEEIQEVLDKTDTLLHETLMRL